MARLLIDQLSTEEWDPTKHPNEYRQALQKLLASKKKFAIAQPAKAAEGEENVVDLMEALRRSVSKAGGAAGAAKAKPKKAHPKRAARGAA